jgi:hypothetical protein
MKTSRPREGWPRFFWGTVVTPLVIMSSAFIAGWVFPPSVFFWGDASAAGARVYVDGALVGRLPGAADSIVVGGAVYRSASGSLEHPFRPGRHSVVFVSRLGDSLSGEFRTRDASSVSVSFFTKTIRGVEPLRR